MTRSTQRGIAVVVAIVALLAAAEFGLNRLIGDRAPLEVVNEGPEPIEDLVATHGGERVAVGRVEPGRSAIVRLSDRGTPATLVLTFRQRGNALGTYELPGFSPAFLSRDRMKQVLRIRPNEVERYIDDDDAPATPAGRLLQSAGEGLRGSLDEMGEP